MAADEDAGILADADIDLGNLRMAIGLGVGLVKQGHGGNRNASGLHDQGNHLVDGQLLGGRGQSLKHEVVYLGLAVAEDGGMFGVGGDAFQADDQHFPERADILVGGALHAYPFGLFGVGRSRAGPGCLVGQSAVEILAVFRFIGRKKGRPQFVAPDQTFFDHG